ncbi:hypothetical protein L1987_53144 [Smallanthus sonchifolius]|uniref:Uncharacterized protein n=1 Tax=Smallanthus sonchifolius TaxID=185202 RepID=A0ACB9EVQ1_9ASTR|nr:hypothetical protein L1987_53144 [Smallanthus sonchifolius]
MPSLMQKSKRVSTDEDTRFVTLTSTVNFGILNRGKLGPEERRAMADSSDFNAVDMGGRQSTAHFYLLLLLRVSLGGQGRGVRTQAAATSDDKVIFIEGKRYLL